MATVNKDFRVKNGLVVEGAVATVNGSNVLTEDSTTFLNNIIKDQSGDLLANATLTNLTISYDDANNALTISAENGVADSDTDDLAEGTTNLYFTDERAQDAFGILVSNGSYSGATVTYDDEANAFNISITDQFPSHDTDDLAEGTTNLYFTDARALNAVQSSYEAYADQAEADAISTAAADATLKANDAQSAAEATASADATSKANTAESNANTYTDNLIGDGTVDGTSGNTVTDRIDTAVANLIGGAPELLDTLDEIAAAIADDDNFSTTVLSDIAQGLTDANAYTDTRETAITSAYESYADTAEADAISAAAADATTKANTAESNANTYTDGQITTVNGTIDALDTDDIDEGSANLYFTDQRAVDALEAVVPSFTAIEVNSVAKQVAATASLSDTAQAAVYSFAKADYRSAKLVVKAAFGTHTEVSEVLITLDTSDNIAITEYAVVGTNGNLGTVTAGINADNVEVLYTAGSANTNVTVFGTLIA